MKYLILLSLFLPLLAIAQSGTVKGVVKDSKAPVPFANVGLVGTSYGAATDIDRKSVV
mgnify:CR=1 FL=1